MKNKQINSAQFAANIFYWISGIGGLLLIALLGRYVWKVF